MKKDFQNHNFFTIFSLSLFSLFFIHSAFSTPQERIKRCIEKVKIPEKRSCRMERVLVKPASQTRQFVAPVYGNVLERVCTQQPRTEWKIIPAQYTMKKERIRVQPEKKWCEAYPAQYKNIHEKVLVRASRTEWRSEHRPELQSSNPNSTGETKCLIEIPAQYKSVTKKVMIKPAGCHQRYVAPVYKWTEKRILVTPERRVPIKIPGRYENRHKKKMIKAGYYKKIHIPAQFTQKQKCHVVQPARYVWKELSCEKNILGSL